MLDGFDGSALAALALSLRVATIATALVALVGIPAGYLLARRAFFGRELIDALVTLPLVLPPTVVGYYLILLLGRNGLLGELHGARAVANRCVVARRQQPGGYV